jgi:hypothetical protein
MDGFVDSVSESLRPGRKLDTIDAVSILFDIHRKAKDRLGGDSFITPDSFFPIGLKIYRDIEELCIEDIRSYKVREIQPFTEEVIPAETLKRLQSLSFFYDGSTRPSRILIIQPGLTDIAPQQKRLKILELTGIERSSCRILCLTESEKTLFKKC